MNTLFRWQGKPGAKRRRQERRGTVLIFVVAMLALLAVMGTAYLLSARMERIEARNDSESINLDFARDAALNMVREEMYDSTLDSNGAMLTHPPSIVAAPASWSRYWDYPETGTSPGKSNEDSKVPDEEWLTAYDYTATPAKILQPSFLTPQSSGQCVFDPSTGKYDIGLSSIWGMSTPANPVLVVDPYGTSPKYTNGSDGVFQLLSFSTAAGTRFRVAYVVQDACSRANLNTGTYYIGPSDSAITSNNDPLTDYGATLTCTYLASPAIFNAADAANAAFLHFVPPTGASLDGHYIWGRFAELYAPNQFQDNSIASLQYAYRQPSWESMALTLEYPNPPPNSADNAPTAFDVPPANTTPPYNQSSNSPGNQSEGDSIGNGFQLYSRCIPFDLTDELELRAFGTRGTAYVSRPASLWPATLGSANNVGSLNRDYYTTYSWVRNYRGNPDKAIAGAATTYSPAVTLPYTFQNSADYLTPGYYNGSVQNVEVTVWPAMPRKLGLNTNYNNFANGGTATSYSTSGSGGHPQLQSLQTLAINVTNMATAMVSSGYTTQEALAFAANYLTYMSESTNGNNTYSWSNGPSWIDSSGMHIATSATAYTTYTGTGLNDLHATAGYTYVGYTAQPFINEITVHANSGGTLDDWAVELANPNPYPIALNGNFQLTVGGTTSVALTGTIVAASGNTPGLLVVRPSSDPEGITPAAAHQIITGTQLIASASSISHIELQRKWANPVSAYATVDEFDSPTASANAYGNAERSNQNLWGCANATVAPYSTVGTIGLVNGNNGAFGSLKYAPLYDRTWDTGQPTNKVTPPATPPGVASGGMFYNITDFNRIGRIANIVVASTGLYSLPISQQIKNLPTSLGNVPSNLVADAEVHFDFLAPASQYQGGYNGADDPRAITLLDYVNPTDRASDPTIVVDPTVACPVQVNNALGPNGAMSINKLRLPGRINVNTASPQVLQAIPGVTAGLASAIVSYRTSNNGIRSLGELLNVVAKYESSIGSPVTTIDQRDSVWGQMANECTTRSDTFVVYGYIEAVKENPTAGSFNNGTDWYDNTNIVDDPAQATSATKLIRVAKRRFLAIVDRSYCNVPRTVTAYSNTTPYPTLGTMVSANGMDYVVVKAPVPRGELAQPPSGQEAQMGGIIYYVPECGFQEPKIVAIKDMPY